MTLNYQTRRSAGLDLTANEDVVIYSNYAGKVHTGIYLKDLGGIPEGYCGLIVGRSGLAAKYGIGVTQGVGLIDADYEGELVVLLSNHVGVDFYVKSGDRIAQLLLILYTTFSGCGVVNRERGADGFGSTGV
jgi:dUTP pyrophosphatase